MQFFNKNQSEQSERADGQGFFLTNRQLSLVVATIILIGFFVFMAGYFLGQKKALQQFSNKLELDSFSDKIYSSMYALYDSKGVPTDDDESEGGSSDIEDTGISEQSPVKVVDNKKTSYVNPETPHQAVPLKNETPVPEKPQEQFYAQLAGFGSSSSAYAFASRLNKHTTMVHVKKHVSKTAKGKERCWYQVTTKPFNTKEAAMSFVERVKREEHLKDVRLISC